MIRGTKSIVILCLSAITLSACATQSFYGPAPEGKLGFQEQQIEQDRFRVDFTGKSEAEAKDMALVRAAELALETGHDWFQITDGELFNRERARSNVGTSVGIGVGSGGRRYGRRGYRRGGSYSNVGVGINVNDVISLFKGPRITSSIEVLMGKGTPPRDVDAYDARDIIATVGPRRVER